MKFNFVFFITFLIICIPVAVQAADFVGMVGIPGLSDAEVSTRGGGLNKYINTLYRLSISIAALLAVIKIVMAGAKYMLSDIVTHKEDAKKDIQGALIGLLIVIGAIVILNTVNSDLTKVDLDIKPAEIKQGEMTLDEAIRRATEKAADEEQKSCDNSGGCTNISCNGIGFSAGNFITSGVVTGGTLGAFGLLTGPTGAITTLGGAAIGSIIGGVLYLGQDYASCPLLCSWNSGVMNNDKTICRIPNNPTAFAYKEKERVCTEKGGVQVGNICEFSKDYYSQIAETNCKDGLECKAEACDYGRNGGIFAVSCESQCTSGQPNNYYDETSEGCVYPKINQPTKKTLATDSTVTYSQLQNEDEIAGDYPVRNIVIMSNESVGGYVRVRYLDDDSIVDLSCSYIKPSVCQ